ncbi:hypothetical protein [Lysobacter olei]
MRKWMLVMTLVASPMAWAQTVPCENGHAVTPAASQPSGNGSGAAGGLLAQAYAQHSRATQALTNPVIGCGQVTAEKATPKSRPRTRGRDANRFYMEQNGKKMTARDFDAWMKSRGIRVATGKPKPAPKRKGGG